MVVKRLSFAHPCDENPKTLRLQMEVRVYALFNGHMDRGDGTHYRVWISLEFHVREVSILWDCTVMHSKRFLNEII
jgi:hypothetical protein